MVVLLKRLDDWSLTSRQQRLVKTGGRLIKQARYDCRCQWDEAETLTGADLVKKEIEDGVVVKIYSVPVRSVVWCLSPLFSCKFLYLPRWTLERELINPNTFRSHKTTAMTTTAFKIDLMEPAIGLKLLTTQRRTPTTTRATKI